MKKLQFGDTIVYDTIFAKVAYISEYELASAELFDDDVFTIVEPRSGKGLFDRPFYPAAYRKIILKRQEGEGIVIGQTRKVEGIYHSSYANHRERDYESAYLEPKRNYLFWVVAIGINKTVLVPK